MACGTIIAAGMMFAGQSCRHWSSYSYLLSVTKNAGHHPGDKRGFASKNLKHWPGGVPFTYVALLQGEISAKGYPFRRIDGTMKASDREQNVQVGILPRI